jgi:hypothetical protein
MGKKTAYCVLGASLIALAAILGRMDGYGADTALLVALGVVLLIASADLPTKRSVT